MAAQKKKRAKGPTKTRARNIDAAEKRVRAVQLRREHNTFKEIGAVLGFSAQRAHKIVTETLDHLNALLVTETDALRQQQLDRIERLQQSLLRARRASSGKVTELQRIDRLIKLMEREAKLAGLDAPTKSEFGGPNGGPIPVAAPTSRAPVIFIPPEDDQDAGRGGSTPAPAGG